MRLLARSFLVVGPAAFLAAALTLAGGCGRGDLNTAPRTGGSPWEEATGNCIACHQGIEAAHPYYPLGCAHCHGGNPKATRKEEAHVQAKAPLPNDATVLPEDYFDKEYLRFVNPTNLRVVQTTCGQTGQGLGTACHASYVSDLKKSMMATTTGHLAGGAWENGLLPDRTAIWGNMPVVDDDGDVPVERGALHSLDQVPGEITSFPPDSFERHYSDVPRKICTRCHLWSRGRAPRDDPGHKGEWRSEGCAACHMPYADDGLSRSGDPTRNVLAPGHPEYHRLTRKIPYQQCSHCHYRGARIGLSYQGMAQLPPGTPTGPNWAGLTSEPIYGSYEYQNPEVNPPDIHMERGMHCIDCHVREEIMGDGNIYGHMDQATEIECEDCHGTPEEYGTMLTEQGRKHTNLRWDNGRMILTGKVDGAERVVKQVKDIVDPASPEYNPLAAQYMTASHLKAQGGVECYTCHSAWQNNCYGCHFNRELGEDGFDMIAGEYTPGKPSTAKKYFLNFKAFQMGWNKDGKVAPYVTGCQVLATVNDELGQTVLHQEMPVTARGLSGLSMNPVNPHTTRVTPRRCEECHRNPAALGLGTDNFNLTRRYLFALAPPPAGGLIVVDRSDASQPQVVGYLTLTEPRDLVVWTDPIDGFARRAYVADGVEGLVVVDLSDPVLPTIVARRTVSDPRDVALVGDSLFVASGSDGLVAFDLANPTAPVRVGSAPAADPRGLAVHGIHLLVADGDAGLRIFDVRDPALPVEVALLDLNGADPAPNQARSVALFPHYSDPPASGLKPFRMEAYVADGSAGVRIVDLGDPQLPVVIQTIPTTDAWAVFPKFHYDPGDETTPSLEHEYLFIADGAGGLRLAEINDPLDPTLLLAVSFGSPVRDVLAMNAFEPPLNKLYVYAAAASAGVQIYDFSDIRTPVPVAAVPVTVQRGLDLERVILDQLVGLDGQQIKDVSHDGARTFDRAEIERILGVRW